MKTRWKQEELQIYYTSLIRLEALLPNVIKQEVKTLAH